MFFFLWFDGAGVAKIALPAFTPLFFSSCLRTPTTTKPTSANPATMDPNKWTSKVHAAIAGAQVSLQGGRA
jgi:hypothetical protein